MFTFEEKTIKRHNVNFIAKQAKDVLELKGTMQMCINELPTDYGQLYTTVEASGIINNVVFDSRSHRYKV